MEQRWDIRLWPDVEAQILGLAESDSHLCDQITARIDLLEERGPSLGRPVVDRVKGSTRHNMKELRADSIRILFVFDPKSRAILLVMGDKRGEWNRWYPPAIALAEERLKIWIEGAEHG